MDNDITPCSHVIVEEVNEKILIKSLKDGSRTPNKTPRVTFILDQEPIEETSKSHISVESGIENEDDSNSSIDVPDSVIVFDTMNEDSIIIVPTQGEDNDGEVFASLNFFKDEDDDTFSEEKDDDSEDEDELIEEHERLQQELEKIEKIIGKGQGQIAQFAFVCEMETAKYQREVANLKKEVNELSQLKEKEIKKIQDLKKKREYIKEKTAELEIEKPLLLALCKALSKDKNKLATEISANLTWKIHDEQYAEDNNKKQSLEMQQQEAQPKGDNYLRFPKKGVFGLFKRGSKTQQTQQTLADELNILRIQNENLKEANRIKQEELGQRKKKKEYLENSKKDLYAMMENSYMAMNESTIIES